MSKKNYEVTLFNHKFTVKSDSDEKHVQRVADHVNRTIFNIRENTHSVSSINIALLTALNIADDFLKMKQGQKEKNEKVKSKIAELIKSVEKFL